jgi:hypothetical protein
VTICCCCLGHHSIGMAISQFIGCDGVGQKITADFGSRALDISSTLHFCLPLSDKLALLIVVCWCISVSCQLFASCSDCRWLPHVFHVSATCLCSGMSHSSIIVTILLVCKHNTVVKTGLGI